MICLRIYTRTVKKSSVKPNTMKLKLISTHPLEFRCDLTEPKGPWSDHTSHTEESLQTDSHFTMELCLEIVTSFFFFFLMYVSETLSAVIQKGGKIHRLCQDLFSPFSVDPFKLSCVVYLSIKLPFSSWLSISGSYNHTHHCWDFGTQGIILLQETTES